MVAKRHLTALIFTLFTIIALGVSERVFALFGQTASDLAMLEDALEQRVSKDAGFSAKILPMLVATPVHHWVESRNDFAAEAFKALGKVFNKPSDLINCPDCDSWRLHVREGAGLLINNGELSLGELDRLRKEKRYGQAKSLAMIAETPAGVDLRIIDLSDGRILFQKLADSTERLSDIQPYLHFQEERERRERGESLFYVFVNLGFYPNALLQTEFLEQWGDRNQYITGLGLSLVNPNFSLGLVTHYMIPKMRQLHVGAGLYMPLQNALQITARSTKDASSLAVAQAMLEYTFGASFGVFASVSTQGQFSLGVNLYNPLLMPFLL